MARALDAVSGDAYAGRTSELRGNDAGPEPNRIGFKHTCPQEMKAARDPFTSPSPLLHADRVCQKAADSIRAHRCSPGQCHQCAQLDAGVRPRLGLSVGLSCGSGETGSTPHFLLGQPGKLSTFGDRMFVRIGWEERQANARRGAKSCAVIIGFSSKIISCSGRPLYHLCAFGCLD